MIYKFVQRNSKTGNPEVIAELHDGNPPSWKGIAVEGIKEFTAELSVDGQPFDVNNAGHRARLPELVRGSYFWATAQ